MQCQFVVGCTAANLRYNSKPSYSLKTNMAKKSNAGGTFLVIVESPAKARTISKFLGPGYTIEASIGHIRDLPQAPRKSPPNIRKRSGPIWASMSTTISSQSMSFPPIKRSRSAS